MHRCAKGRDEDGAGWGGSMAPINGLIIPATQDATPCWEEIQKMKEEIQKHSGEIPKNRIKFKKIPSKMEVASPP